MHLHLALDQLDGGEQERGESAADSATKDERVERKFVGDEIWVECFTDEGLRDIVLFLSTLKSCPNERTTLSGIQELIH